MAVGKYYQIVNAQRLKVKMPAKDTNFHIQWANEQQVYRVTDKKAETDQLTKSQ